jgi:hypothetical protein
MLTIFLLTVLYNYLVPTSTNWKLAKEKDGIRVYTRTVSGTAYQEVKSEVEIAASPEALLQVLNDYSSIEPWRFKVIDLELLDGEPMGDHQLYFALGVPFPLSDRDFALDVSVQETPDGGIRIPFQLSKKQVPNRKGRVRMDKMEGFWSLEPQNNGRTLVTYQYLSDPAGIPAWIVNMFTVTAPYQALKRLRERM